MYVNIWSLFILIEKKCVGLNLMINSGEALHLHRKLLTKYPQAICNDGSVARYQTRVRQVSDSCQTSLTPVMLNCESKILGQPYFRTA